MAKELDVFCSKVNTDDNFHDALAPTSEGELQHENAYSYLEPMLITILALAFPFYNHSMLARLLVLTVSGSFIESVITTFIFCFTLLVKSKLIQQSFYVSQKCFTYPAKLLLLSCVMLTMWFVSLICNGKETVESLIQPLLHQFEYFF